MLANLRRRALAISATSALLLGGGLFGPAATAAPTPRTSPPQAAGFNQENESAGDTAAGAGLAEEGPAEDESAEDGPAESAPSDTGSEGASAELESGDEASEKTGTPADLEEEAAPASLQPAAPLSLEVDEAPATDPKKPAPKAKPKPKKFKPITKATANNRCAIPTGRKKGHKTSPTTRTIRINSSNRYTAAGMVASRSAKTKHLKERAVFLAPGTNTARGAAVSALAAKFGWPVVVTPGKTLGASARKSIKALKPTHIYVAGGTGTISKRVVRQAKALGVNGVKVKRFTGNAYVSSRRMAECFPTGSRAFVASASASTSMILASSAAVRRGGAVLVTPKGRLGANAKAALGKLKPSRVDIIGGSWSKASRNAFKRATKRSAPVRVVAGKNQYETSAKVAKTFFASKPKKAIYSSGTNRRLGVAAIGMSRQNAAPILFTKKGCLPSSVAAVNKSVRGKVVVGTTGILSKSSYWKSCAPKQTKHQKIVAAAKSLNGKRYASGGTGPHAFDCSGFTQHVYKKAGIKIPRTSWSQWSAGKRVSKPKAGDIVVMSGGGHVAIYLGNGMIIDAGSPRTGVSIRKMWAPANAYVRFT